MDEKIKRFLKAWNEMMDAANDIKEFKYEFSVDVGSDNKFIPERERLIDGINESFARNNMKYESVSKN